MNISFFISLRYLYAKRKQVFISFVSVISILGVALGVGALIITLSVMNGFQRDLTKKIFASNPHLLVSFARSERGLYKEITEKVEAVPGVVGASPFIYGQGMLKHGKYSKGVVLKGVTYGEVQVTGIGEYITQGAFIDKDDKNGIVLGKGVLKELRAEIGDEIVFLSSDMDMASFVNIPTWKKLIVKGCAETGLYYYDSHLAYINLDVAQDIFKMKGEITGLGVKIKDPYNFEKIEDIISHELDIRVFIRSWLMANKSLFSALKLEKIVMFIILTLIIIVAAFGIISSLMLMTMEKTRDIGILKALGLPKKKIAKIFIYQGLFIGFIGTLLGCLGGLVVVWILGRYNFIRLPADVYYLSSLPVSLDIKDILIVMVASVGICLVSTLYPARRAAGLDASEAIRYE